MAVTRGCNGVMKVATTATGTANSIGEVRSWSFEETSEQLDVSSIGTCTKSFTAGAKQTTGQIQCWWDANDTNGQNNLTVGTTVWLEMYPGGATSGDDYYKTGTGGAVITSVSRSGGVDGAVESTFAFSVNGELTATSVP